MDIPTDDPRRLLTPRMAELLGRIARAQKLPLQALGPSRAKAAYRVAAEVLDLPRAHLGRVEELAIPMPDGYACPARLYAPQRVAVLPPVLYLHGGGFMVGGLDTHNSLCRQLALRADVAVVALDYRKSPEHRFPKAVDDTLAALRWLARQAGSLGLDGQRLAVAGDSAGGTLAAVAAHVARDEQLPLSAQLLITPGVAATADAASHRRFAEGFLLDADTVRWFFGHYIDEVDRCDWRFAPLLAPEFEGLAPTLVLLAECDPLVDDGVAYADRLRLAGVPVDIEIVRGVTHDFIKMGRALPEAVQALEHAATFLKRHLRP